MEADSMCRCINRCNHTGVFKSLICPARLRPIRSYPISCKKAAGTRTHM